MLPDCRTPDETFAIPTFDLIPSDVEGFIEELWEFQSTFHDCFARSEPRVHFFDYMVGQCSNPTATLVGTCSSITKIYGASNTTSFCRLCPENRDSTWVNLVSTRK